MKRLEQADSKVREIERKIDEIDAGRSLSQFILERVQAEDYRKYLGIISTIRKDFERLGVLLKDGQAGLDKVGRLILYIDDLDRCPTHNVVEVLQAVHLLLALPLFVAVVGVDLRWLLHSLQEEYTAFQGVDQERKPSVRPEWITSPQNYLEKIFQIPFNLNPMESTGYQRLVKVLLPETVESPAPVGGPDSSHVPDSQHDGQMRSAKGEVTNKENAKNEEVRQVHKEKPSEEIKGPERKKEPDLNPASLRIQPWERELAELLFPFIPSPRAAKRFVNVYRLLKAPLSGDALRNFEGTKERPGDFQAAMLLLAAATGISQEADKLFSAILSGGDSNSTWRQVFTANLSLSSAQSAVLSKVSLKVSLKGDLYAFQTWAPKVARFTFEAAKSAMSARNQRAPVAL